MLASERQIIILKKLEKSGVVYLKQLSEELHASICTIRRDLKSGKKTNAGEMVGRFALN
ncbi:MAG: DeoR family transcriptional regulator [[Clostridium] innocuum]